MLRIAMRVVFMAVLLAFIAPASQAAEPRENSIPIVGMRINWNFYPCFRDIRLDQLCSLMWRHIQGTHGWEWASQLYLISFMERCDETGMLFVFTPSELGQYDFPDTSSAKSNWFRNSDYLFSSPYAYAQSTDYEEIDATSSAVDMNGSQTYGVFPNNVQLVERVVDYNSLWFYYLYDEGPGRQRANMIAEDAPYEVYFPNIYTQAWTQNFPSVPALSEVESSGLYSWLKYVAEHNGTLAVPTTLNFSMMHTIPPGAYTGFAGCNYGTFIRQAISVRAICEAMYQGPPSGGVTPQAEDNPPQFICFDYYPFRYVDINYASTTTMCDDDWLYLINHFEEGIDSTIVPALEYDVPTLYFPQAFGSAGGPKMLSGTPPVLHYTSYNYRKPAPQEFLMLCNLALLHQAKGICPYSLRSYIENPSNLSSPDNFISCALLDMSLIPFDAPYEEYVYTERWPKDNSDYVYQSPEDLPPWNDGFDPLYSLPSPPSQSSNPKYAEWYNEWLFKPYGDLYKRLERNLAQIVRIGPEMYNLFWCEDYENAASMETTLSPEPSYWIDPRIKVFENDSADRCYLFYVNRFCRAEATPFEITFESADLPAWADCSNRLLDHSRRFIMDGTESPSGTFTFLDTLGPGEARLVELIDTSELHPADARITDNDVWTILPAKGDTATTDMAATPGETLDIVARFYNMGTGSKNRITVGLYDTSVSPEVTIDTAEIDFYGLPYSTGNCRQSEYRDVIFEWAPDIDGIGAHRLEARATPWIGEPDRTDNTARMTFLVEPNDWATEVLGNPWDMTEVQSPAVPPAWYTNDISSMYGWTAAYTDSISGMFEGSIDDSHLQNNIMTLNMNGYHITGDDYSFITLIGKTEHDCDVYLTWETSQSQIGSVKIGELSSDWGRTLTHELSANAFWAGKTITSVSLSFRTTDSSLDDNPVRIGWVRLENGEL